MRSKQSTNFTGLALNSNDLFTEVYSGSATIDPVSLLDGAGETVTITVTGAELGDFALFSAPYSLQGITATAYVSAADTVSVRLQNESGATVDLASGTWKAKALR
jgi:hypothetical protein